MMLRRAALLPALAALSLAACAVEPPADAPPQPPAQASAAPMAPIYLEPRGSSPVDKEMLAIAQAEDEIDRLFPDAGKERRPRDAKKADKAPAKDETQALSSTGDACTVACRALSSMITSAEHLCKLSGEMDGRCEDARGRVRGASARVKLVCPTCSAAAK